ncbi:MAG: hypothetical protein HN580_14625 [Deltaproteobacteria bacterium]|jgi:hypothetical protein|nr:hypothetical protein [Deltaproteobacteria bacterium]MBT4263573.1 hypothetical protein [Deltaproteobacteria bacterium]MBT4644348.1 hypothetical protein [Deltaproteobacteria bacterium]MBT6500429.1 hypothetical protein [Deltaproteobacteria bacterium]MBT6615887.1 hypothetical protein [Deltaproteobacteria bacterium]
MKIPFKTVFYGILLSLIVLAGCETESGDTVSVISPSIAGSGAYVHVDQEGGPVSFEYSHASGSTPQDIFFIFTNTSTSNVTTATTVSSLHSDSRSMPTAEMSGLQAPVGDPDLETYAREHGIGLRGKPEVTAYNANPPQMNQGESGAAYQLAIPEPLYYIVGDTNTFMNASTTDTVPATVRQIVTDGTITLNIWVADDAWSACSKHYCLDQAMVDAFRDKFLQAGSDNDIYDWVTNIFGSPWGSHSYDNLISATAAQSIDILFFDISNDGNLTDSDPNGGILGFFWSKDSFLTSSANYSNERLLFYMDSVLSAKKTDASWEISDYWPSEMVSTLAHEFQHMIHFYQKNVKRASSSETWINEMASMVTEDLLADKMLVNGPRGVSYTDDTAGSSGNTKGRLPVYNNYDYIGPTVWYEGNSALISYGINYAFGAYLARNYGGAALFQSIVQSSDSNYQAIVNAVVAQGYTETFTSLLQKWGVAVLSSDDTSMASGYLYNTGGGFTSTLNGISYNLGSVNLHNYDYGSLSGPKLHNLEELTALGGHYKMSNTYVRVGTAETGTFIKTVQMAAGIKLTVVTKDSQ